MAKRVLLEAYWLFKVLLAIDWTNVVQTGTQPQHFYIWKTRCSETNCRQFFFQEANSYLDGINIRPRRVRFQKQARPLGAIVW